MHKPSPLRSLSAGALTAALFGAALLTPGVAAAQDDGMSAWRACLKGKAPSTANVAPGPMDQDPSRDEVILDFRDHLSDAQVQAIAARYNLKVRLNTVHSDPANLYVASVPEGAVPYIKDCLAQGPDADAFEIIEENFGYQLLGEALSVPEDAGQARPLDAVNDPLYQFQWNFKQVNAEEAWKTSTGRDVVVAVIDTGVAVADDPSRHIKAARDLKGTAIVPGYDFVDKNAFVFDGHGHGTHVAGTIAQTTNNKYGVAGLAYNAKIMGLRVLNSQGFGQVADIADAVRFAADHGAQVINMSLGGPLPSLVLKRAIEHAHKKGVTVVAAAGNGGRRIPSYPAAYDHVIAVAATQYDRSTTFYSQWGDYVDIAAPGGNTRVDQDGDGRPDGILQQTLKEGSLDTHDFLLYMGTSMASPHVAAGAAMIISQGVTHPDKVEAILKKTANTDERKRYSDAKEFSERYGAGIMQVDQAVKSAQQTQGGWRLAWGMLLPLLAMGMVRRRDMLGLKVEHRATVLGASALTASGLFFLPMIFGDTLLTAYLSKPLAELDILIFGLGSHQNPLMASALIPALGYALLAGHKKGRALACGVALGMAAFCLCESILLTSDVRWIPGMGGLDRAWLAANGMLSLGLGYIGLKRY